MRHLSPSLRDVSFVGRIAYGAGLVTLLLLALATIVLGTLDSAFIAGGILILFVLTAPYVLGGRWRAPKPVPTRRPVVRRRRY
jgi:hypothetical protein